MRRARKNGPTAGWHVIHRIAGGDARHGFLVRVRSFGTDEEPGAEAA